MNLSVWENIMRLSFIFSAVFFIGTVIVIIKFNIVSALIFEIKQKKSDNKTQTNNIPPPDIITSTAKPITSPDTVPQISEKKLTATVSVRNPHNSGTVPVFQNKEPEKIKTDAAQKPVTSSGVHKDTIIIKKPSPVITEKDSDDIFTVTESIVISNASDKDLLSIDKS
mgnify:FL=1